MVLDPVLAGELLHHHLPIPNDKTTTSERWGVGVAMEMAGWDSNRLPYPMGRWERLWGNLPLRRNDTFSQGSERYAGELEVGQPEGDADNRQAKG